VLRAEKTTKEWHGGDPHQVNIRCSSGLGNVAFGGEFGDEINVPSSNCDRRWKPPILMKDRIKNGAICGVFQLGKQIAQPGGLHLLSVDWCCHP